MSKVFTMAALHSRTDEELRVLFRKAQQELTASRPGSADRRNALASLENISRAIRQRHSAPRP